MFDRARRDLEAQMDREGRLPPGQSLTLKFPVLHYGPSAEIDRDTWTLRAFGLVDQERTWGWAQFSALPTAAVTCDIHCVTRWSKFDTVWEGVPFREFVKVAGVKPEARLVIAHCAYGFTTSVPLELMLDDDVLLAYKFDGRPLEQDHGYPVRTLVPKKYFGKSAKWLLALEFTAEDRLGFWEQAGYNNNADPFREERYAGRSGGLW
ncbi:MAG: sulfite oxidase-like oxidoreductase [Anaerolineae bacterium]|nr:sulfite oxidase-like oxidoreductase [Anaerolineae bacterium]